MWSEKWRPFYLGHKVLKDYGIFVCMHNGFTFLDDDNCIEGFFLFSDACYLFALRI